MPLPNSSIPSGGVFDLPTREARLQEIETIISSPDAWSDQEKMTPVLREKSRLEAEVARFRELQASYEEMEEWLGFVSEGEEEALETLSEQADILEKLLTETPRSENGVLCEAIVNLKKFKGCLVYKDRLEPTDRLISLLRGVDGVSKARYEYGQNA